MREEWMRRDNVDILRYLPVFLAKDSEFKAANDADSREHERIRAGLLDLFEQLFAGRATWGLDWWEKFLGIPVDKSNAQGYEYRRDSVLARLMGTGTMTPKRVTDLINVFVTGGRANFVPEYERYAIMIRIPPAARARIDEMHKSLEMYLPAHITWRVTFVESIPENVYIGAHISARRIYSIKPQRSKNNNVAMPTYVSGMVGQHRTYHIFPQKARNVIIRKSIYMVGRIGVHKEVHING